MSKTVKVLVDGVGPYNAGDIVTDAPAGLVEMAEKETRNAASGELLVQFHVEHADADKHDYKELKEKAKALEIPGYTKMKKEELEEAVAAAELAKQNADGSGDPDGQNPDDNNV